MKRSKKCILSSFSIFLFVLVLVNYFIYTKLNELRNPVTLIRHEISSIEEDIILYSQKLDRYTVNSIPAIDNNTEVFLENIRKYDLKNVSYLWKLSNGWISKQHIVNHTHREVGNVFGALKYVTIIKADLDTRGSQLKFLLTLQGNQVVIFKPKWYEKERILEGPVYGGKDRHTSEIIAFYLSIILNLPYVPFSVERKVKLRKELIPVASKKFKDTSFNMQNKTCVYGKCFYCSKRDAVCSDEYDTLTGAVIFNIKNKLKLIRSPWMRTYKIGKLADWEQNESYCNTVRSSVSKNRLLEMVDTAVFDFFIQNGDRHHFETMEGKILLIDNGKGLGNPYKHHIDILAPLYQCCVMRKKTWRKLLSLSNNRISHYLKLMPDVEDFLISDHLKAMDKRLSLVFGAVEYEQ